LMPTTSLKLSVLVLTSKIGSESVIVSELPMLALDIAKRGS
jgi:hypothetical protein